MARCPAHEDRRSSLSIVTRGDGRPWLTCHAGCSYREIVAALLEGGTVENPSRILSTLGGQLSSGQSASLPPSESAKRPASLDGFESIYDYEDENGKLLFKVLRTKDKRFFQCHPDPESPTGFYWGLNGVRRVPYRLPRVREAVRAAQTVYIVEGEKDVHAVERVGGTATCNPMGASKGKSKWRPEWNEYFNGANVVIIADRDEAGQMHAMDVYQNLSEVAFPSIYEAKEGKDAYDHLCAGYELEELEHVFH